MAPDRDDEAQDSRGQDSILALVPPDHFHQPPLPDDFPERPAAPSELSPGKQRVREKRAPPADGRPQWRGAWKADGRVT
jgi:hypothetical protein